MSAQIIRNVVAGTFNIDAKNIILSGELAPYASFQNYQWNGSMGETEYTRSLFGWNPKSGFVNLSNYIGLEAGSNYAHSERYDEPGTPMYAIEFVSDYIFFFLTEKIYENWEGSQYQNYTKYTLFKAPNFAEHIEKLEAADIARWEHWLAV